MESLNSACPVRQLRLSVRRFRRGSLLLILSAWLLAPGGARADERVLQAVWKKQADDPSNHVAMIGYCQKVDAAEPLLPVVRGLCAWHQLAAGQREEALTNLTAMLSAGTDPVSRAANAMALRWLTRLDREKVRKALTSYYADHVAFPSSLAPLEGMPAATRAPMTDRWGVAWTYRLADFKRLQGLRGHRYVLESRTLGGLSDLDRALAVPYASRIFLRPLRVLPVQGPKKTAEFEVPGPRPQTTVLLEDGEIGLHDGRTITFVMAGQALILLSDGDHWMVLPRPGAGGKKP